MQQKKLVKLNNGPLEGKFVFDRAGSTLELDVIANSDIPNGVPHNIPVGTLAVYEFDTSDKRRACAYWSHNTRISR